MQPLTSKFPVKVESHFAGFSFPHQIAALPKGSFEERIKRYKNPTTSGYRIPLNVNTDSASFYLESDFMPSLRWAWCDDIPGDWDETSLAPNISHTGWFIDDHQDETMRGIVLKLPRNRGYLAGWSMGEGMISEVSYDVIDNVRDAVLQADSMAENVAELNREMQGNDDA